MNVSAFWFMHHVIVVITPSCLLSAESKVDAYGMNNVCVMRDAPPLDTHCDAHNSTEAS